MKEKINIRFDRQIRLNEIGIEGQLKLNNSKVLVVGAGGLGCPALQYLSGAGIGQIGIVDGDVVSISNLHRQVLYAESDIGEFKVNCAKKRLEAANSRIEIKTFPTYLDKSNVFSLISEYDVVLDGTDQIHLRYLLGDVCRLMGKPLVYGAIHKFEGQVSVFNYKDGPGYRDLFPIPPNPENIKSCSEVGVLGVLPGTIGAMQASEVLKIIVGYGKVLAGKLYMMDLLSMESYSIDVLSRNDVFYPNSKSEIDAIDYRQFCGIHTEKERSVEEVMNRLANGTAVLLDIREKSEQPRISKQCYILEDCNLDSLEGSGKDVFVICQSGIRSLKWVSQLKSNSSYFSVRGGIDELKKWTDNSTSSWLKPTNNVLI